MRTYLIPRIRTVEWADSWPKRVTISPSILHCKLHHLLRSCQEQPWILRINFPENHGRSCQCSCSLSRHIRAWVPRRHRVHCSDRVHVLRPLPALVVGSGIPNPNIESVGGSRCTLDEVVRGPADGGPRVL